MFLQSITAVNGEENKQLETMVNPPILSDVTEKNKEAELYSEYFMPVNEYKPSIGEYKKKKAGPSAVKILCWVLSLFLLAGAIVLAVLIGSKSLFTPLAATPHCPQLDPSFSSLVFLTNSPERRNLKHLYSAGIIDTDPSRTIKVSRNLEPKRAGDLSASVDLIEVNKTDLPNVRTNQPEFFTSKSGKR